MKRLLDTHVFLLERTRLTFLEAGEQASGANGSASFQEGLQSST